MNILRLITGIKEENSQSFKLGNAIVDKIQKDYPMAIVREINLSEQDVPHLKSIHAQAFYTAHEHLTPEMKQALVYSDEAISALMQSDIIVIDTPMYNFAIPSTLKAWFDQVLRAGITFRYTDAGPEGLVKNKKAYLAIATGGVYSEGPLMNIDFTENYLRTILGFIGINDVSVFRAQGTVIQQLKDNALSIALHEVEESTF